MGFYIYYPWGINRLIFCDMKKISIKESELVKLIEVAMDLDKYTQLTNIPTNNGNVDTQNSIEEIISKLKELLSMFEGGKKVDTTLKSRLYKNLDDLNDTYERIKY